MTKDIVIRLMKQEDVALIVSEERAQGWDSTADKYEMRLRDMAERKSLAFVAEYDGEVAGYNNLYFKSIGGPFLGTDIPEVVDFGVFERFRRNGIGAALMDKVEEEGKKICNRICLGVGLHYGYGSAQRMYVKRGYIPDGSGVWYCDKVCEQYAPCKNDDELVLYFLKEF